MEYKMQNFISAENFGQENEVKVKLRDEPEEPYPFSHILKIMIILTLHSWDPFLVRFVQAPQYM